MKNQEPTPSETPPRSDLRFIIIGAGMSGILTAIKLEEAGLDPAAIARTIRATLDASQGRPEITTVASTKPRRESPVG